MWKYKINNSSTVYVNDDLYKQASDIADGVYSTSWENDRKKKTKEVLKEIIIPLNVGALVTHKVFGVGTLTEKSYDGSFKVKFAEKTVGFKYPLAFKKGILKEYKKTEEP